MSCALVADFAAEFVVDVEVEEEGFVGVKAEVREEAVDWSCCEAEEVDELVLLLDWEVEEGGGWRRGGIVRSESG